MSIDESCDPAHGAGSVYFVQHQLLDQIPALDADVRKPPQIAAAAANTAEELTNAWLGSRGCVSRLHYYSADNMLVQIAVEKAVLLMDESQSAAPYLPSADANVSLVEV